MQKVIGKQLTDRVEKRVNVIRALQVVSQTFVQSHVFGPSNVTDHQITTLRYLHAPRQRLINPQGVVGLLTK